MKQELLEASLALWKVLETAPLTERDHCLIKNELLEVLSAPSTERALVAKMLLKALETAALTELGQCLKHERLAPLKVLEMAAVTVDVYAYMMLRSTFPA